MILLLSSSKSFGVVNKTYDLSYSIPCFIDEASILIRELKRLNIEKLKLVLKVSQKIAETNLKRYQKWSLPYTPQNSNQAILSFSGDVYKGLNVSDFTLADFEYAQRNVGIISGLFGMLRPLDLIQPYRLEMATPIRIKGYKNLYDFWSDKVSQKLNSYLDQTSDRLVVNLASNEYFKVLDGNKICARIFNIEFKEKDKNGLKFVAIYAKRARGLMCRYAIRNNITNIEELKQFDLEGYSFNSKLSSENNWIFTRKLLNL